MAHATLAGTVNRAERWSADEALEALYAAHWRPLVRLAVLLVRDVGTAEEVVQDAFVAMHGRWGRLDDNDKALAYLRQSVVNRSRSVLRHQVVVDRHLRATDSRPYSSPDALWAEAPADAGVLDAARRGAVLDALAQLPQRQREVLVLRHYLDLSETEIADTLGIARGSVKSHASRGSAALRVLLGDLWKDES